MPPDGTLEVTDRVRVPLSEFRWTFVRSGGPGGQNVNKVASRAVLRWKVSDSPGLPEDVCARVRAQEHRRINAAGELILSSERYRDQPRNVADCLEKLRKLLGDAATPPKPRRRTRPTRGSRQKRLQAKSHRSAVKKARQHRGEE